MSFDRVAPFYRTLERLVFGDQLQQARAAFVREIERPRRVLIVGEGDGRFLAEFVQAHPAATIDCLDASARMIKLARRRVRGANVRFVQGDIREAELQPNHYDLLVTHFFLDCFSEDSLVVVIRKLASSAAPDAQWLIADFSEPGQGGHLLARIVIALMYAFFRLVCGIEARRLVDCRPMLQAEGFSLAEVKCSPNRMVCSERWHRAPSAG